MVKIKDIPDITEKYDFTFAFCTFLDSFKRSENKSELIAEQPETGLLNPMEYCMLACAAHKLANDNDIETPVWVYDEKYVLKTPVYALDTKNEEYRAFLEQTSPEEYKQRKLFYGASVLMRV